MISKNNPFLFNRRDVSPMAWNDWKWQYHNRIRSISQLAKVLKETSEALKEWRTVVSYYPFSITPYYFSLINAGDKNDPIRLQCFPNVKEINYSEGGVADPLNEERGMPVSGLVHRYPDRALLLATESCAMYCRHCTRRRLVEVDLRGAADVLHVDVEQPVEVLFHLRGRVEAQALRVADVDAEAHALVHLLNKRRPM